MEHGTLIFSSTSMRERIVAPLGVYWVYERNDAKGLYLLEVSRVSVRCQQLGRGRFWASIIALYCGDYESGRPKNGSPAQFDPVARINREQWDYVSEGIKECPVQRIPCRIWSRVTIFTVHSCTWAGGLWIGGDPKYSRSWLNCRFRKRVPRT